ncbi:MAG: divergent polysaccharide deacetylase family protein [Woeseia sp.]
MWHAVRLLPALLAILLVPSARADDGRRLPPSQPPRIAIIIDDLGYAEAAGRRAIHLPGPVSVAVLPETPSGRALAELARSQGRDVLLHLPLQSQLPRAEIEPGGIVLDMSRDQFARTFAGSLASVPHVVGINNHRGSLLTRHPGHMRWLMEEIRARDGLIFIDSYTTHHSVALAAAVEAGVPAVRRDVFLDNDRSPSYIAAEFERLKRLARQQGTAVGIGHPHPETLDFLEQKLPQLAAEGIELVSISSLVRGRAVTGAAH